MSLYSGIRNTRAGYNADAAVWEDLAGQQDITLNLNDKNYFTREGLRLNSQKHSFPQTIVNTVNGQAFTVENAAVIPCEQVLGTYTVAFER